MLSMNCICNVCSAKIVSVFFCQCEWKSCLNALISISFFINLYCRDIFGKYIILKKY